MVFPWQEDAFCPSESWPRQGYSPHGGEDSGLWVRLSPILEVQRCWCSRQEPGVTPLTQGLLSLKYERTEIFQFEAGKTHPGSWCPSSPANSRGCGPASCGHGSLLLLPQGAGIGEAGLNWEGCGAGAPSAVPGSPGWGWGGGRQGSMVHFLPPPPQEGLACISSEQSCPRWCRGGPGPPWPGGGGR